MRFLTRDIWQMAQRLSGATQMISKPGRTSARFGFLVLAASVVLTGELASQSSQPPSPNLNKPLDATRPPDANQQVKLGEQQARIKSFEASNIERKRQISDDSATLIKLAAELKDAVDKTSKDTLSIGIIRKADEIERLAHDVKEKMKLTVGAN